jgi:sigma-B regulation protein RsbU (phosphoserine phosphatase)
VFLFVGLVACGISAIRGRREDRILVWFGLLNVMWGARILAYAPAVFSVLPRSFRASRLDVIAILSYLTVVPGLLFFLEMSRGILRRFLQVMLIAKLAICAAGVGAVLFTESPYRFIHLSNVLVILFVLLVALVVAIPATEKKFGIPRHRISTIGLLVAGVASLYANLREFFGFPEYRVLEPLAFAVLIFSLGYVVAERLFSDGRRLIAIENELAIAREIQTSILPNGIPEINSLLFSAAYCPMTAVAGDFYEFIPVDQHRVGFLVADVSGHGRPGRTHRCHDKGGDAVTGALRPSAGRGTQRLEPHSVRSTAGSARFRRLPVARHGKWSRAVLGRRASAPSLLAAG